MSIEVSGAICIAIKPSEHVVRTLRLRARLLICWSPAIVKVMTAENGVGQGASRIRAKTMKIKFTWRGLLQLHDQTVIIEIEGDTLTYDRLREAERKFLVRFRGEERENKLIEWKSGPIEGEGRHSEYRAYLPLSE